MNKAWKSSLIPGTQGPRAILANAIIALRLAPEWAGRLHYDEMHCAPILMGPPPWEPWDPARDGLWRSRVWDDRCDLKLAAWLQRNGIYVRPDIAGQAVEVVAGDNSYHPVRQYLGSIEWDTEKRLDDWVSRFLGVERSPYTSAVGRAWLISAVARVMKPGCQADHCLILEGEESVGKTSALRILGGDWYVELTCDLSSKDAMEDIRGAWIVELADLDRMTAAQVNRLKAFICRTSDRRRRADWPRQCVYAGSINPPYEWNVDANPGRRWWPIRCEKVDLEGLAENRNQLWAEAVAAYRAGETWLLDTGEFDGGAAETLGDPLAEKILRALKRAGETGVTRTQIRDIFSRHRTADQIERALALLAQLGQAEMRQDRDTGGRPRETWVATPGQGEDGKLPRPAGNRTAGEAASDGAVHSNRTATKALEATN